MPPKLNPTTRTAIARALRNGKGENGRNALGREFGVSGSTVARIATEEGIVAAWDRSKTKRATEARQVDLAARMSVIAERNIEVAETILDSFDEMTLDDWSQVSAYQRGIVLGILQDKTLKLAPADDDGQGERQSMLTELFDMMRTFSEADTHLVPLESKVPPDGQSAALSGGLARAGG